VRGGSTALPRTAQIPSAVELLPVHHIADESFLVDKGLSNHWGSSSIGYLAPNAGYSSSGTRGEELHEFKTMVKTFHQAGIEVIMDVVYNHTAEGNHVTSTGSGSIWRPRSLASCGLPMRSATLNPWRGAARRPAECSLAPSSR
jgi:hypothetical protein